MKANYSKRFYCKLKHLIKQKKTKNVFIRREKTQKRLKIRICTTGYVSVIISRGVTRLDRISK